MATSFTVEFEFRNQRFDSAATGLRAFYDIIAKDWDGSAKVLSVELRNFLNQVVDAIVSRNSAGWPGGTTATSLSKRTGGLVAAIQGSVQVTGTTFETVQGSIGAPGVPYARIQETGGIIKAKNVKFLTIPLKAAMDSRGVPIMKSARDWSNTFVAKSKAGNLIIFQRRGAQIVPLYVLKPSVKIPARLNMRTSLDAGLPYFVDRACDAIVRSVTEK
jgi:hypothetical protein